MIHLLAEVCVVFSLISTRRQLTEAWGQFLSQFSWNWFVTLTFRDWVVSFRAHRLFGYFVRDLEKAAGNPIFWFRADEVGPHGGRFHIHALIGNVAHMRRMTWVDKWDRLAGFARILPFDSRKGAAYYTAKYITKQFGDWEMSDNLRAFTENQPVLSLEGMSKPQLPQQPEPLKDEAASKPKRAEPKSQFPLAAGYYDPILTRDATIEKVYRSEVSRGRGGYRKFFPTNDDKMK